MTPDALAILHSAAFIQDRPWSAVEFHDLLASPYVHLSARAGGFALWRAVAKEAELLTIAVDPAHQRQGVGIALMTAWLEQAATLADTAFLEVAADNDAACGLYERCGFDVVARRTGYYDRATKAVDALVMRAPLTMRSP